MATEPSGQRVDGGPSGRQGARSEARRPPPRKRRKARMVHRVVRHVEVWSVAKVASAFAVCGYVIGMVSGYLLWRAADRVGTIDGIEGFMVDVGAFDQGFELLGSVVFQAAAVGFAVLSVLFVAMAVLGAVLFNLISDLTGGIRMTAIDEDLIVTPARRPRNAPTGPATPPAARAEASTPAPSPSAPSPEKPQDDGVADGRDATAPPSAASSDPWKMPAPNETWTAPAAEHRNGNETSTASLAASDGDTDPADDDESIRLGSADRVV